MWCFIEISWFSLSSLLEVTQFLRNVVWIINRNSQIWEMLVHYEYFVNFFSQQSFQFSQNSFWYHHKKWSDLNTWLQLHETCISWYHIANQLLIIIQVSFAHVFSVQIIWMSRSKYYQCTQSQRHQENHEACHWYNAERCWIHSSNQKASQVVQINLIVFEMQCTFHHLFIYKFDWKWQWYQVLWNIMFLRVNLMFLESRKLSIDFEL